MRRIEWRSAGALLLLTVFYSPLAHAFKTATIRAGSIAVHQTPDAASATIDTLRGGTRLYTSDQATGDFYKVKTPSGKLGWVSSSALQFAGEGTPAPSAPPAAAAPVTGRPPSGRRAPPPPARSGGSQSPSGGSRVTGPKLGVRLLAGLSLFSLDKINGLFNIAELKTGVGFGGELFYRISPKLSLLFHVETISKAVQVEVTSTTPSEIYDLKASSMPVMVGVDYSMMDQDSIRADFGVLAGLGLSTKFNSQASGATAPNITTYSGSPLTFMARFLAEYQLTRKFGIGGYAGYRILKLSQAAPTTVGKTYADDPLLDATGAFTPQEVNLSGPILGLSTTFRF